MKILIFSLVVIAMIFSPPVRSNAVRASSVGHPQSRSAGQPPAAIPALQGSFGSPITFATHSDLQSYGFSFGPADGQFGAMPAGNGNYVFFGAAGSTAACGGTPSVKNGAFTFTGTLDHVTGGNGCKKLFGFGDGPSGWVFDTGYAGGGQVVRFSSGGRSGWLMPFHSEFQWQNPASADQKCGGVPCFYGSIGLAVSTDDAKTFQVVGQIVQPSQPLSAFMGGGRNMGTGYGTMVVADANGKHLDNPPTDPSDAYFYLFYTDLRPDAPGACAVRECLAVVRAPYSDVVAAALSGDPHRVATVFHKYDGASPDPWTQPATSDTPDESGTSGTYAPLWSDEGAIGGPAVIGSPGVIYDSAFDAYLAVYGSLSGIKVRASSDLIHWSQPISAPYTEAGRTPYQTTLIGETGDPTIAGATPRIYFTSFPAGAFPNWSNSIFETVPFSLSPATPNTSP